MINKTTIQMQVPDVSVSWTMRIVTRRAYLPCGLVGKINEQCRPINCMAVKKRTPARL